MSEPNPFDPTDAFEPLRPRRRPWRTIVGIIAIAALVLTAVASYVGMQRGTITQPGDDEGRDDGNDVAGDRIDAFIDDGWDERVVELVAFVETERGLEFEHPVEVDFLTPEEFSDELRGREDDITHDEIEDLENLVPTLRALGLLSGEVDLIDTQLDLVDTLAEAFYNVEDERIVVPIDGSAGELPSELPSDLRVTLVHELVHALQDQHFGLDRDFEEETVPEGQDPAAASAGFTTLVEGDAVRIQVAYAFSLSDAERDELIGRERERLSEVEADLAEFPGILYAYMIAPYELGRPLVEIVALEGGNEAVDQAFEEPPWTDRHVLDPTTYLAREPAPDLDPPALPAGAGDPIDEGQLGALDIYLMLAERIDPLVAMDAADAWGNAQYVTFEDGERTCVRAVATGISSHEGDQLLAAFEEWVAASPPAADASLGTNDAGDTVLESCDPGPGAEIGHDRAGDVLQVPAIRSTIVAEALQFAAMPIDEASDLGDCFVRQFSVDELVSETEELPQDTLNEALAACGF